jgi:hypothetical protein
MIFAVYVQRCLAINMCRLRLENNCFLAAERLRRKVWAVQGFASVGITLLCNLTLLQLLLLQLLLLDILFCPTPLAWKWSWIINVYFITTRIMMM